MLFIIPALFIAVRLGGNALDRKDAARDDAALPLIALDPVTERDHVRGNASSGIYAIEYSDFECPFCKAFHLGMKGVVEKHPDVGFVFRHYPLDHRFPLSRREAEASECAYAEKGHAGFFRYLDLIFKTTESENSLSENDLFDIARIAKLDEARFKSCYDGRDFSEYVEKNRVGGVLSGVGLVPSVILMKDGVAQSVIAGASAARVDAAIAQLKNEGR